MTTLKELRAEHQRLAEKIAAFEVQAGPRYITIPRQVLALDAGDYYAGIITNYDGSPAYHLILLEGRAEQATHEGATEWVREAGGELPNRREQVLLYANLQDQFEKTWYWSGEHATPGRAWALHFGDGYQGGVRKDSKLRARAVRRVFI